MLAEIDAERFDATVFLRPPTECDPPPETRRRPLAPDAPSEGIRRERCCSRLRADLVLDTSEWSIHEVRSVIHREFSELGGNGHQMLVSLISFGFKFGFRTARPALRRPVPAESVFRAGLRAHRREPPVQAYLDAQADFPDLLARLRLPSTCCALSAREPQLSLDRDRLHGRTAPLGGRRQRLAAALGEGSRCSSCTGT